MQPCWAKIINAVGFSCLTFDIYEIDKCIVVISKILVNGCGIE